MDKRYLEFWGNFFLQAARSQEQMEELNRLARQGFHMAEAQWSLFRKFYGLEDSVESGAAKGGWWQKSFADFKEHYREFLELLGVVPKEEYDELAAKYEALKKEAADREKIGMKMPEELGYDQEELAKGVQDLVSRQSEQFKELMRSFGQLYAKEDGKEGTKKKRVIPKRRDKR